MVSLMNKIEVLLSLTEKEWGEIAAEAARHSNAGTWTGGNSYYWAIREWLKNQIGIDDTWDKRQERKRLGHLPDDEAYVKSALREYFRPQTRR